MAKTFLAFSLTATAVLALASGCSSSNPTDDTDRLQLGLVVESADVSNSIEGVAPAAGTQFVAFTVTIGNKAALPFALANTQLTAETPVMPMADVSGLLPDACRDEMTLAMDGQVTCRFVVEAPVGARITRTRLTAPDGRSVDAAVPAL